MDPIHPIIPVQPRIPPITPAPLIGGIDRDRARGRPDADQRRRRRPGNSPVGESDYASEARDGDEDSGLHIDVTA
jgi:hypothetical protein